MNNNLLNSINNFYKYAQIPSSVKDYLIDLCTPVVNEWIKKHFYSQAGSTNAPKTKMNFNFLVEITVDMITHKPPNALSITVTNSSHGIQEPADTMEKSNVEQWINTTYSAGRAELQQMISTKLKEFEAAIIEAFPSASRTVINVSNNIMMGMNK